MAESDATETLPMTPTENIACLSEVGFPVNLHGEEIRGKGAETLRWIERT